MKLFVKEIINSRLATKEDQAALVISVLKENLTGENILLSFLGVDVTISNFAHRLVHLLYIELPELIENKTISLIDLSPSQKSLFNICNELTTIYLGLSNEINFPKTKKELKYFISSNSISSIKVSSEEELAKLTLFLKENSKKRLITDYLKIQEELKKDSLSYILIKVDNDFVNLSVYYKHSEKVKENTVDWSNLK